MPKEHKPNCFGYVFHSFGLIYRDRYVGVMETEKFTPLFEEVPDIEDADIVAAIGRLGSLDVFFAHVAVVDKTDRSFVFHRWRLGDKVKRQTRERAFERYTTVKGLTDPIPFDCRIAYLKLKR